MKAFTLWTEPAIRNVLLATSSEYGLIFGIGFYGEVWFRFSGQALYCHAFERRSAIAIMERRNS